MLFYKNIKLIVIIMSIMLSFGATADIESKFKQLETLIESNDLDSALSKVDLILADNQDNAKAHFLKGIILMLKRQPLFAIRSFSMSIAIKDDAESVYNNRGLAYLQRGEIQEALSDFNKAISLNDNYYYAYFNRGTLYLKMSNYKSAIEDFEIVASSDNKDSADAKYRIALCYLNLANYSEALTKINSYIESYPKDKDAYQLRATIYTKLNNTKAAEMDLNKYEEIKLQENLEQF